MTGIFGVLVICSKKLDPVPVIGFLSETQQVHQEIFPHGRVLVRQHMV
jgi:hypothetical protein